MRKMVSAALTAAFIGGGSVVLLPAPAEAQIDTLQSRQRQQQRQPEGGGCQIQSADGQRTFSFRPAECAGLAPLLQAVGAQDWAAAQAALPAARAAAQTPDAKYVIGQTMLRIGLQTNNAQLQAQAVEAMLESGAVQRDETIRLLNTQFNLAVEGRDFARAERTLARLAELSPGDSDLVVRRAQLRALASDRPGAIALYQQAIQARRAAGQPVPAEWRQQIAGLAYEGRLPETMRYMREWLEAAPSANSWHDTLVIYAEQSGSNSALKLDVYRLMRAAGAMLAEHDFIQYSEAANEARLVGEVAAVLEDGLRRNLITANAAYARERLTQSNRRLAADRASLAEERTQALAGRDAQPALRLADAYFGYGQYAEAAELYRAALERGADANLVNTRLGAALALAGRRAEAEAAFRTVGGPRAELANLWLLWLSQRS